MARVTTWATTQQIPVDKVVTEVGSALNGRRRKLLALLRDSSVQRIVVEQKNLPVRIGVRSGCAGCAGPGTARGRFGGS